MAKGILCHIQSMNLYTTLSSNVSMVGWNPGKALCVSLQPELAGNVTVREDWSGTMMQLNSLQQKKGETLKYPVVVNAQIPAVGESD